MGGLNDLVGGFETFEECENYVNANYTDWAHILDTETNNIINVGSADEDLFAKKKLLSKEIKPTPNHDPSNLNDNFGE